ncbi:MAG: LPS assembly protein LptD [Arsenophonus sp. ER-QC15-MAG3]
MKKNFFLTLLVTMFYITIHTKKAYSNLTEQEQCILLTPMYIKPIIKANQNNTSIYITSKNMVSEYPYFMKYSGNVNIQYGNQIITANEVELIQKKIRNKKSLRTIIATGNIHYSDQKISLNGQKARLNLNNKDADIEKANYFIFGRHGRGYANKIKLRDKNRYTILEKGMFTTCHTNNNIWSIVGSEVILDHEKEVSKIWNAQFRIANIPIFYSPYLELPIGNKRRSGLLLPNVNYSKISGLNFELPFYWNIAHNYDLTITPQFISSHGLKISNEFRYITITGDGIVVIDWLKHNQNHFKDKNSGKHLIRGSNDRWLLYWDHSSILNKVFRFNINYKKVSDSEYFTDFTSKYGNSTDEYTIQKFSIGYTKHNWNLTLTDKQFQVFFNSSNTEVYKTKPQLDINFYKNNIGPFDFKTYAQISRITSTGNNNPNVIRLHIQPELNMQLSNNLANMINTLKLMATYYNHNITINTSNKKIKKQVIRILPLLSSNIKFHFKNNLLANSNFIQILEPWVQYLYIPYSNQNNINNYDSSLLKVDYNGLFREYIYSGIDRIASSNRLSIGIATRIYDKTLIERFNFSIGQIYYFKYPRTSNSDLPIKNQSDTGILLCSGETYLRLTDKLGLRGKLQYDKRFTYRTIGNLATEYRLDSDRFFQLNYRFVHLPYIKESIKNSVNIQKEISQIGTIVNWPLGNNWKFIGSYYHDMKKKQPVSRLIGLQYRTCCWSINISYERKIIGWQQLKFISDYDNQLSINMELKGLNNHHNFGSKNIITNNILPYHQRTF